MLSIYRKIKIIYFPRHFLLVLYTLSNKWQFCLSPLNVLVSEIGVLMQFSILGLLALCKTNKNLLKRHESIGNGNMKSPKSWHSEAKSIYSNQNIYGLHNKNNKIFTS